ncbi:hydrolytic protein [Streptomyces sp. NPDC050504]|uniref:hydrolytic protein n=1 Tax=Streptomyces sp. NPDC050504 TaxID=3365618 RepID=UPI0037A429CC
MTTSAKLDTSTVTVAPGGRAATSLTVHNTSDIVEGYTLEVVGDCAPWTTIEPAKISLYPGTSQTVTVHLAPPRSPEVRAGEVPLGVRVLPKEHPESVAVPETTVYVEPFQQLRVELVPQRRRGWRGARYRTTVRNTGNIPVDVALAGKQEGEDLQFGITPERQRVEPGARADARLQVKVRRLIWFGQPTTWPFEVQATETVAKALAAPVAVAATAGAAAAAPAAPTASVASTLDPPKPTPVPDPSAVGPVDPLQGEFVQMPLLPRWLLAVLAALLALILAWFMLVRPAVRSTAQEAADKAVKNNPTADSQGQQGGGSGTGKNPGGQNTGQSPSAGADGSGTGTDAGSGGASTGAGSTGGGGVADAVPGSGRQSSATIDVETGGGTEKAGTYSVPAGKVFGITDAVVANFQGDEGVLTISFGATKVTTIALETFRNQDYHWVTPIRVPENETVTVSVTCAKPGTPASGQQASGCHEVLNVSGVLSDIKR